MTVEVADKRLSGIMLLWCSKGKVKFMMAGFQDSLSGLRASSVRVSSRNGFPENGQASITLFFDDGTRLQAEYWRVIDGGTAGVSSFDHQQKYGLPAPIDAVRELEEKLSNKVVVEVHHDQETGDLLFHFAGDVKLQILNFSGYEVWEIRFPNGTGEFSNYAK
jgi:hypothetical protein